MKASLLLARLFWFTSPIFGYRLTMIENSDSILNPTVYIGALEVREPVTAVTDFMIAITCGIAFWLLTKSKRERSQSFHYYRGFFLMYAIGMTSAAWLGHGLQAYFGLEWKMLGWFCSMTGQALLAIGSLKEIESAIKPIYAKTIIAALIVQYIVFGAFILYPETRGFQVPQTASVLVLTGFVIPMQLFNYLQNKNIGSMLMITAIIYGIVPGYVYSNQISINKWFNYHDISHVLVVVYMIIMIFAVRKLAFKSRLATDGITK